MSSTTYAPLNPWRCSKSIIQTNSDRSVTTIGAAYHFAVIGNMVRNSGELPQPFWLGATCGGGSCSLSASVARA